ncbi:MAG: hypothetical protein IT434_17665 [Phycisphaerales bacterium]|nr:hypothetical protein [Phycisphaerales bacterium]
MSIVYIFLITAVVYLAAGLVFAIPFVIKGVDKIDEGAHGSKWGFRIIIIPGTMVFWPLLLKKWMKAIRE